MLARMLTLSFTSLLLSCDQQLLVYVSAFISYIATLPGTTFRLFSFLLPFCALLVNSGVGCRGILIGGNSRCHVSMILIAAVIIFS